MVDRSRSLSVDTVIYDLEDSVTPDAKAEARALIASHLAQSSMGHSLRAPREACVRINVVNTGPALQDLTELVSDEAKSRGITLTEPVSNEYDRSRIVVPTSTL